MCPHSAHLRRCNHHAPRAKHSTQPVPLDLAVGLIPSLWDFIGSSLISFRFSCYTHHKHVSQLYPTRCYTVGPIARRLWRGDTAQSVDRIFSRTSNVQQQEASDNT